MKTYRYEEYLKSLYMDNSEHREMFEELLDDYIEAIEKLQYIGYIIDKGIDVDDIINEIQDVIQGDLP